MRRAAVETRRASGPPVLRPGRSFLALDHASGRAAARICTFENFLGSVPQPVDRSEAF